MNEALMDIASVEAKIASTIGDGGPFGAVIIDERGSVISTGHNTVLKDHDPTSHAEINAIREACKKKKTHNLNGCTIYSSCEPCPMCLSAIIWANIKNVYFASTRKDAEKIGFRDNDIYEYLKGNKDILNIEKISNINCDKVINSYNKELY